jgi:hypothetical protein
MNILKRRPTMATSREAVKSWTGTIARWASLRERDLDVFGRLNEDELADLMALTRELETDEGEGFDSTRLEPKQLRRWERLVGKAAGDEDLFERRREGAEQHARLAELARRARTPAPRPRFEQPGSVHLPREWCFEFVRDGILFPSHLAVLVLLEAIFENGQAFGRVARLEGSGDDVALVVDATYGLGLPGDLDPDNVLATWKMTLEHLELNQFVKVERRGRHWRIRRGARSIAARAERSAA